MDKLIVVVLMLLCAGCGIAEVRMQRDSVKPTVAIAPDLRVESAPETVKATVESGAFTVGKAIEVNVPANAIHVEPINVSPTIETPTLNITPQVSVASEALKVVVPPEAVKVTLSVADGAIRPQINLTVAEGAVVFRGAEIQKGAVSTLPLAVALILCVLAVAGWIITKARFHHHKKQAAQRLGTDAHVSQRGILDWFC